MAFEEYPFVRTLLMGTVAAAGLAAGWVSLPPLFRPGTPVSRYRQLPGPVARDLNRRGCNIVRGENVISGDFAGTGERDWAVLCQQDEQASVLLYLATRRAPAVFGKHGGGLSGDPEGARSIRLAGRDYVARHNPGVLPGLVPNACVEDEMGMGSSIYCYVNGAWAVLTGAD